MGKQRCTASSPTGKTWQFIERSSCEVSWQLQRNARPPLRSDKFIMPSFCWHRRLGSRTNYEIEGWERAADGWVPLLVPCRNRREVGVFVSRKAQVQYRVTQSRTIVLLIPYTTALAVSAMWSEQGKSR
jgi:hypothetical protein